MEVKLDTKNITQNLENSPGSTRQLPSGTILVNRYMIQEVIGIGGMGSVYRARDMHFPNAVKLIAIKEMFNQARDPLVRQTIVQNFEREAHILVSLAHPSIPKIFDFFTFNERSYLVLEYINGKDLEAIINSTRGFLNEEQVLQWMVELCDVLAYLHGHKPEPIIFRDIKPSNIMINQDNHVMLIDFGIAKIFNEGQKGTMIGTEGYSPPEQYRGEASQQADIYALGATIHHLLTRRDPRLEAPFTFGERPIRQINPSVSIELETVINTALNYTASLRFSNVIAMKDALLSVARKTGALSRMSFPAESSVIEEKVKPLWIFQCEDEVRGSPSLHNNIVYVGALDNNLYALSSTNGEFLWKYPTEGGIVSKPLILDDAIFFGSADGNLYSLLLRTGKANWTYQTGGAIRSSPRNIETQIVIGSDDGYLHAVNMATGTTSWKVEASGAIRSTPFITPDQIIYGDDNGDVCCLDYRGHVRWRFKAKRGILTSPLVDKGMVFVGALDTTFYALDSKSGWVIWRFRMGKGTSSSPCRIDNCLIFGSADEHIYCVDASNAKEIWRFKTEHQVSGSPVVYKDSIYCGSADGHLYCLEYRTGRLRWKFATGGPITGAPVVQNDIVYFGSNDHTIYALLA